MSTAACLSGGLGTFGNIATIFTEGLANNTAFPQPPAAGTQYEDQTVLYTGSGYSLQRAASPAVQIGDVFITPTTVSPGGYVLQVNNDGTVDVFSGGNTSRQSFPYSRYNLSLNTIDGPATVWINEVAPHWAAPLLLNNLPIGALITAVNLATPTYATSPSGDTLAFSLASGVLPPGINLSSAGAITGTPSILGTYTFTINATDYANSSSPSPSSQIYVTTSGVPVPPEPPAPPIPAGSPLMPNVVGNYLWEAIQILQTSGVFDPTSLGYFGTYPISVLWIPLPASAPLGGAPAASEPFWVTAQSVTPNSVIAVNSPIVLTAYEPHTGVVFP